MILLGIVFILSTTLTSCGCKNKRPKGKTAGNNMLKGNSTENKTPKGKTAGNKAPESKPQEEGALPITDEMLKGVTGGAYHFLLQVLQDLKAKKQVDINAKDSGRTALHYAAQLPNVDINIVKALVERKAAINIKSDAEATPLTEAATQGNTDVVKFLLEQPGIDVNADEYGQTALHLAAEQGHKEIVLLLLNHPGIAINKAYIDNGVPKTARSIAQERLDTIQNFAPTHKLTPYKEIIDELTKRGCNP